MGEAFKIHSQALVGYDDSVTAQSDSNSPTIPTSHLRALEMQPAY
jgi:hypothetical protein